MARVSPTFSLFVALPSASIGCRQLCAARRVARRGESKDPEMALARPDGRSQRGTKPARDHPLPRRPTGGMAVVVGRTVRLELVGQATRTAATPVELGADPGDRFVGALG